MPSGSARIPTSSTSTTIFRLVLAESSIWLGIAASDRWAVVAQDVAGGAAKDHLPQSALCVSALDQEVTAQCVRVGQNDLTRQAAVKSDGQRFCRHLVQLQITAQLLTCWSRYRCSAFDRQHGDAARALGIAKAVTRACSVLQAPPSTVS